MDTTNLMTAAESQLAAFYARNGLPCQINASLTRLVIYAATPEIVRAIAKAAAGPIDGVLSDVLCDSDEDEATRYFMAMPCDLSKLA